MRLSEILSIAEKNIPKALDILLDFNATGSARDVDSAYEIAMRYFPHATYSGHMYRAIQIKKQELEFADTRLITAKLQRWNLKYSRKVVSWSYDLKSAISFGAEIFEFPFAMILHQRSKGLKVEAINDEFALEVHTQEQEIMSRVDNNVSVYGFATRNLEKNLFFPYSEFKEFIKYARENKDLRN